MSSSERSIPHLRDIFGLSGSSGYTMHNNNNNNNNQLHSSNNISHYHNNHNINHHYPNGNGNVVSYVGNNNTSDINDHSSYGPYDNHHHQQIVDSNLSNNNNNNNNTNNNKKISKKKRDNSKTLTSGDVKTLERHLSMKKTIRKKIMRDLQQAFVEDPNEFRIENINQEQLKAEIRVEALRFGATSDNQKPSRKSDNFLDMLRGEKNNTSQQQQLPPQQQQQQQHQQQYNSTTAPTTTTTNSSNNYNDYTNGSNREYDYDSQPTQTTEKQSFWRRFTMKNKTKR